MYDQLLQPVVLPKNSKDNVQPGMKCDVMGFGLTVTTDQADPWPVFNQKKFQQAEVIVQTEQVGF